MYFWKLNGNKVVSKLKWNLEKSTTKNTANRTLPYTPLYHALYTIFVDFSHTDFSSSAKIFLFVYAAPDCSPGLRLMRPLPHTWYTSIVCGLCFGGFLSGHFWPLCSRALFIFGSFDYLANSIFFTIYTRLEFYRILLFIYIYSGTAIMGETISPFLSVWTQRSLLLLKLEIYATIKFQNDWNFNLSVIQVKFSTVSQGILQLIYISNATFKVMYFSVFFFINKFGFFCRYVWL